ncbi:hypothetical protein JK202_06475 [Gluconobacter sp. Dm-62]|uniref:hypothetical protein n=1 Tax=Gluconobacter sp. Dm-62 TaxID=2799804 RepID=UPI001B8B06EB|nr:hypothetical protein [Gluconobacter sp. Dm-62]MBS1102664.1 hypothetical protein [Gluconobacter sp. Dm-62]
MRVGLSVFVICAGLACSAQARGINTFIAPDMHYHPPPPGPRPVRCKDGSIVWTPRRCRIIPPVMERTTAGKTVDSVRNVVRSLTGHTLGFHW